MDPFLNNESRGDRLIEDYLFSDYERPSYRSTFALDQQFAKPIEDEDLFGGLICCEDGKDDDQATGDSIMGARNDNSRELRTSAYVEDDDESRGINSTSVGLCQDMFTDQENRGDHDSSKRQIDIDDIFANDYSDASEDNGSMNLDRGGQRYSHTRIENLTTGPANPAGDVNSEKLKQMALKMKIREQVLSNGLTPNKLQPDEDGKITIDGHLSASQSDSDTKFLFSRFFNRPKRARDLIRGGDNVKWPEHRQALLKQISASKRKIWDSFQAPCDNFDEDEEMIDKRDADCTDEISEISDGDGASDDSNKMESDRENEEESDNDCEQEEFVDEASKDSKSDRLRSKTGRSKQIFESDDDDELSGVGNFEDLEKEDAGDSKSSAGFLDLECGVSDDESDGCDA